MGDVELLQRARRGDELAFAELFTRYEGPIYRYAAYMCGRDAADDIVQETFLAILQQTKRSDAPERVVSYLIGIARHRILKRAARGDVWPTENVHDEVSTRPDTRQASPLEDFARTEDIEHVRAAVESLPAAFREAVVLCDLQEMDYAAAAAIVGCPIGTIRSRLHRARALLAPKLRGLRHEY